MLGGVNLQGHVVLPGGVQHVLKVNLHEATPLLMFMCFGWPNDPPPLAAP
jgi:hypothetical protein